MFPVHTHLRMMADRHRVEVYKKGIFSNVRTGDVVADIGAGSGILSFFALKAGAGRVYAVESAPIIETAKKIAAENGLADKIVFINKDSRKTRLPEKVDVIITETFGGMGIDEGTIDILADAGSRFLKPGGKILPERMTLRTVPVFFKSGHPFKGVGEFFHGLKMKNFLDLAANNYYGLRSNDLENCQPVGNSVNLFTTDFLDCKPLKFPLNMVSETAFFTKGTYDGMVLYPELVFPGGLSLSLYRRGRFVPTHWEVVFFPLQNSLRVNDHDSFVFHLTVTGSNGLIWKHEVVRKGKRKIFAHLSAFGLPSLSRALRA